MVVFICNLTDYLDKICKAIFIDEAHYLPNLGIILKISFDEGKYRVVVTGSGMGNELVGRKAMVYIYPFDFEDFSYF